MVAFGENLRKRGILKASDSLGSTSKGVRVELRGGRDGEPDRPGIALQAGDRDRAMRLEVGA